MDQLLHPGNTATRRQVANALVNGIPPKSLNAAETAAITSAQKNPGGPFEVTKRWVRDRQLETPAITAAGWAQQWLASPPPPNAIAKLAELLAEDPTDALATFLQTPDYAFC